MRPVANIWLEFHNIASSTWITRGEHRRNHHGFAARVKVKLSFKASLSPSSVIIICMSDDSEKHS